MQCRGASQTQGLIGSMQCRGASQTQGLIGTMQCRDASQTQGLIGSIQCRDASTNRKISGFPSKVSQAMIQATQILRHPSLATCNFGRVLLMQYIFISKESTQRDLPFEL